MACLFSVGIHVVTVYHTAYNAYCYTVCVIHCTSCWTSGSPHDATSIFLVTFVVNMMYLQIIYQRETLQMLEVIKQKHFNWPVNK